MRGAALLAAAALLAVGALPGPLAAQATPGDTVVLTLEEAIQRAEGQNPAYRQTLNNLSLNPVETRTTWANQLLPSANLSAFSTNYNGNIRRVAFDNFGNPIDNPESEWSFFSRTSQSLSLNWGIQGADLFNTHDRQQRTNFERELAVRAERSTLGTQVERQYFETLEQRELMRMEEELLAARERDAAFSAELLRLARNGRVEVLNAEFAVEQQRATLQSQRSSYEQAKLALRTQIGETDLGPFRLADEPLPVFDPSSLETERLVRTALAANPTVLQAESSVASQRLGVDEAKNQWWPSLNLGYSLSRTAQALEGDALFDATPNEDLDQNFSITLSFPFFNNYFGNQQAIEQAEVQHDNAQEQLRQTRLQTEQEVRGAILNLRGQYESLRLAERSLEIARESLELAREEYRMGTRTFQDLQSSIDNEASARRSVITARYGFVDALLTLEDAVGTQVAGESPVTDATGAEAPGATGGEG